MPILEDLRQDLRYASLAGLDVGRSLLQRRVAGGDGELSAALHGIARIDRQVEEGELELRRIDLHERCLRLRHELQPDRRAQGRAQQVHHRRHGIVDRYDFRRHCLAA